jgi:hypothetical protein
VGAEYAGLIGTMPCYALVEAELCIVGSMSAAFLSCYAQAFCLSFSLFAAFTFTSFFTSSHSFAQTLVACYFHGSVNHIRSLHDYILFPVFALISLHSILQYRKPFAKSSI